MRFGFMEDFRNPVKWRRPFPEFYEQILEQIIRGEALGYDNVWLTEHHFTDDGYNPSLMTTAAAVATRTKDIRIGTFILLLPYQHPMLVAEEVVVVDMVGAFLFSAQYKNLSSVHYKKRHYPRCRQDRHRSPFTGPAT